MGKRWFSLVLFLALCACGLSYSPPKPVYHESAYLEPLSAGLEPGIPVFLEKAPPELEKKAVQLPPVILIAGRNVYFYHGLYYYSSEEKWYFSEERTGPWYKLDAKFYPAETVRKPPPTPFQIERPYSVPGDTLPRSAPSQSLP